MTRHDVRVTELALAEAVPLAHALRRPARRRRGRPRPVHQGAGRRRAGAARPSRLGRRRRARRPRAAARAGRAADRARLGRRAPLHLAHRAADALAHPPAPVLAVRARPARPLPGLLRRPAGRVRAAVGDDARPSTWPAHDIPCPDPAGQALVLALHSLRDPHDEAKAHELAISSRTGLDDRRLTTRCATSPSWRATSAPRTRRRRSSTASALPPSGAAPPTPPTCAPGTCAPSPPTSPRSPGCTSSASSLAPPPRLPLVRRVADRAGAPARRARSAAGATSGPPGPGTPPPPWAGGSAGRGAERLVPRARRER